MQITAASTLIDGAVASWLLGFVSIKMPNMALNRKNRAKIFHNLRNDCIFALQKNKTKNLQIMPRY